MKFQAEEQYVRVTGRTVYRDGIRYLGYSATSISFCFSGTKATAHILSNASKRMPKEYAWVAVFVDNEVQPTKRICLDNDRQEIVLWEGKETQTHQITLMKYSEAEFGACGIAHLEIMDTIHPGEEKLLPPPKHKDRVIEFLGDSITCGYGVEGSVEVLELDVAEENPMKSYSMITAQLLDAEANLVSWNGKGVITGYIGEEEDAQKDSSWLMPHLYEYTDAGLERDYFETPEPQWEKWSFEAYKPQLVIVYLGTNDTSYTRDIPQRQKEFEDAYVEMLHRIHKHNPEAAILCTIGAMDGRLNQTIAKAVQRYRQMNTECAICFVELPEQDAADGLGTFWHPTEKTNKKCAQRIAQAAKTMLQW